MNNHPTDILPSGKGTRASAGLYVHIPFCLRRCAYCDFTIAVQSQPPHVEYAHRLLDEYQHRLVSWKPKHFQTLYVGGGTPSLWSEDAVEAFVSGLGLPWDSVREWTVEFNPECVTQETVERWVSRGANRISLGVQSLDSTTLAWLGRMHDADDVKRSLRIIGESAVDHVSVDVIYGVPGRSVETLRSELRTIVDTELVDHVSAYELTWEPNTPLDADRRRGISRPKDDDAIVEEYSLIAETLGAAGFEHYEVSSYARRGGRAIHNASYWDGTPYLGLGVGAHSCAVVDHQTVARTANVRSLKRYLRDGHSFEQTETLNQFEHAAELCMLGLRTAAGIDFRGVCEKLSIPSHVQAELLQAAARWEASGWGLVDGSRFRPNEAGLLHSDGMAVDAMALMNDAGTG